MFGSLDNNSALLTYIFLIIYMFKTIINQKCWLQKYI